MDFPVKLEIQNFLSLFQKKVLELKCGLIKPWPSFDRIGFYFGHSITPQYFFIFWKFYWFLHKSCFCFLNIALYALHILLQPWTWKYTIYGKINYFLIYKFFLLYFLPINESIFGAGFCSCTQLCKCNTFGGISIWWHVFFFKVGGI